MSLCYIQQCSDVVTYMDCASAFCVPAYFGSLETNKRLSRCLKDHLYAGCLPQRWWGFKYFVAHCRTRFIPENIMGINDGIQERKWIKTSCNFLKCRTRPKISFICIWNLNVVIYMVNDGKLKTGYNSREIFHEEKTLHRSRVIHLHPPCSNWISFYSH